jgi:hypothetical protein
MPSSTPWGDDVRPPLWYLKAALALTLIGAIICAVIILIVFAFFPRVICHA